MARDNLARLVYAVLGLIDGISGNGADGIVTNVPTLAPSFLDEGCPLGIDAITKKNAVAVVDGLVQSVALCHSQRVVLGDGARDVARGGATSQQ